MTKCLRISMWSGPRNISTALMYSFRQRRDTVVVDEPLYGHYLATTGLEHPGYEDVLAAMETDADRVIADTLYGPCERPVLFVKNMAHHMVDIDLARFDGMANVLLTRDPRRMLISLTKAIPNVDLAATGLPDQVRLLEHVVASGRSPLVLTSEAILSDPAGVLSELCRRLGITWSREMLSWPAGPKPEDGVWAPHWYANVHRSTGFAKPRPTTEPFPPHLEPLLAACLPLHARLAEYALSA